MRCQSDLVDSKLDLKSKGCGFESHLISSKTIYGNGVRTLSGPIPAPNSGSVSKEIKKNTSTQMLNTKKAFKNTAYNEGHL